VLCGKSVDSKTKFFGSTAYWRNPEALVQWLSLLRSVSKTDGPLLEWTSEMMRSDPKNRPRAETLVTQITTGQRGSVCYIGSCCHEDSASDNTSWEGSNAGDDVFGTADSMTRLTAFSTTSDRTSQTHSSLTLTPTSFSKLPEKLVNTKRNAMPPRKVVNTFHRSDHSGTISPREHAGTPSIPRSPEATNFVSPTQHDAVFLRATHSTSGQSQNLPDLGHIHEKVALDEAIDAAPGYAKQLEEAFRQSHAKFEQILTQLRSQDLGWRNYLIPLIDSNIKDPKGYNLMHVASHVDDESLARDVVELALQRKPEMISELNIFRHSVLHFAAIADRAPLAKFMIQKGADPNLSNLRGQTALHIAVINQSKNLVKDLVHYMSEAMVCAKDDFGQTALHFACVGDMSIEIVLDLLNSGARSDIMDRRGQSPIDLSMNTHRPDLTDLLLAQSNREATHFDPPPPYQTATPSLADSEIYCADCDCEVCLLIKAVSQISADESVVKICHCQYHLDLLCRDTLSHFLTIRDTFNACECRCCIFGRQRVVDSPPCDIPEGYDFGEAEFLDLRSFEQDFEDAPLPPYLGDEHYDYEIYEELCNKEGGLSQQDISNTVLNTLANAGFRNKNSYRNAPEKVLKWVITNHDVVPFAWKMVEILLDCGARVDTTDKSGCTALHVAARFNDVPLAQILIDRGARIDVPRQALLAQKAFWTPLRYALWFNSTLVFRQLLRAGANPNDQSVYNRRTLLHEAVIDYRYTGSHIPMLLAHDTWTEVQDEDFNTAFSLAVMHGHKFAALTLAYAGANIEAAGKGGAKPLSTALKNGDLAMIYTLLELGADIHARCNEMPCALFYAISSGHVEIARRLLEESSATADLHRADQVGRGVVHILANAPIDSILDGLDLLVQYGANLEWEDHSGSTALHEAAREGSAVMVNGLLEHGAAYNPQNRQGKTPLDLAQAKKHRECVELLGGNMKRKKRWFSRG
jgi:ankyrin repeat protein